MIRCTYPWSRDHISGTTDVVSGTPAAYDLHLAEGYWRLVHGKFITLQNPTSNNETALVTFTPTTIPTFAPLSMSIATWHREASGAVSALIQAQGAGAAGLWLNARSTSCSMAARWHRRHRPPTPVSSVLQYAQAAAATQSNVEGQTIPILLSAS